MDFVTGHGYEFTEEFYYKNMAGHSAKDNIKLLCDKYHFEESNEEVANTVNGIEYAYYEAGIPCKKGAINLLNYLKENGYVIILATSSLIKRAMLAIDFNNLDHYFDDKVFGPEVEHAKPAPDLFLKACEKSGCKPEECVVLEDSFNGIRSANNANIPVICIPDVARPDDELASKCLAVLDDLDQVVDYLKQNNK